MGRLVVIAPRSVGMSPSSETAAREKMDEDSALEAPAAIGPRNDRAAIKFLGRNHTAGGPRMIRKCVCNEYPAGLLEIHVPQLSCPVCSLRANVRHRVRADEQLFPGLTGPGAADKRRSAPGHFRIGDSRPTRGPQHRQAGRPDPYWRPAAASRNCLRQASGAPPHIGHTWIRDRRRQKPRTTKGRGDRGRGEKGILDPRRLVPEKPLLAIGAISDPTSFPFSLGAFLRMGSCSQEYPKR